MSYEQQEMAGLAWALEHTLGFVQKRVTWIILVLLVTGAFLLRCVHMLNPSRYYLLTPDSYFFHWLAQGIMAGHTPPSIPGGIDPYAMHSGLAYPMAYIAKAIASVFNLSSTDSLTLVSKFLPPILGVVSLIVIYLVVVKMYNRRVGLFAAFAWAVMIHPLYIGAGGYVDRDGLSMMLMMIGAFTFYLSRNWHLYRYGRDWGWLVGGLVVLGTEGALYLEWTFPGPVLLLVVILVYSIVEILLGYFRRKQSESSAWHKLASAANEFNWRALALIVGANILAVIVFAARDPLQIDSWFRFAVELVKGGGKSGVQEMGGLTLVDLLIFQFFLIPIIVAFYMAWKERSKVAIFSVCWFLSILLLSLATKRVLIYAAPAACVLAGAGLAHIWEWRKSGGSRRIKNLSMAALLMLLILISFILATSMGSRGVLAPNQEWQDALAYIREETPPEAVIMTQWSWGYWILDLSERRSLVDNGYYYYDQDRLRDVGLAYIATDPAEAARIMEKNGASYLVFSQLDRDVAPTIMGWAELGEKGKSFPPDSLVVRSLNGEFELGGGLKLVYRSAPSSEVVILGLTGSQ